MDFIEALAPLLLGSGCLVKEPISTRNGAAVLGCQPWLRDPRGESNEEGQCSEAALGDSSMRDVDTDAAVSQLIGRSPL
jgi:hypothetical protein